jgi:hypothetical protein
MAKRSGWPVSCSRWANRLATRCMCWTWAEAFQGARRTGNSSRRYRTKNLALV